MTRSRVSWGMERTPGALLSTSEMVAGDRFRYSPSVRRLMRCAGCASASPLARLSMHFFLTFSWPDALLAASGRPMAQGALFEVTLLYWEQSPEGWCPKL